MSPITVEPAAPGQTGEALELLANGLPQLSKPLTPPARVWVAHPVGEAARLLGAAVLWPVVQRGGVWGFRVHCQVLPTHRLQGIGRALIAALAAEAACWGVRRLITWETLVDGPATAFLQATGWRVAYTLHHFVPDKLTALPRCTQLVERLHRQGHVPAGFALLPLDAVPRAPLLALHCKEFNAVPQVAAELIDTHLADPLLRSLSVALWDGHQLAGYLLAGPGGDLPEVSFWATSHEHRSGWAAAVMLHAFVKRVVDGGGSKARYHCNENARAPMNFARRTGAPLEKITRGWFLDVQPTAAPAPEAAGVPSHRWQPDAREVIVALAGLTLAEAQTLCSQGRLPHLAQLLAARQVRAAAQVPWRDAWREGRPARVVGWPASLGPDRAAQLPADSAWVAAEFDDPALLAPEFWALDPGAVLPRHERALARDARMAPPEVAPAQLAAVLAPLNAAAQDRLQGISARLLAAWASRHNLGVHWASHPLPGLMAVRFGGLPEWLEQAGLAPAEHDAALAAWLGFFDLLLGRYRQLLGDAVPLTVMLDAP